MRILHCADTHIGTRQYNLDARRSDFSAAFQRVAEIALDEQVNAVVHAGDLFDDRNPTAEDLQETLTSLFTLKNAQIPFLGIVGNHEQRRGVQWIDLFAQLELAVHLSESPYEQNGFKFYGVDYAGRKEVKPYQLDGGVLVAHQLIDKVQSHSEMMLSDLATCGADVVLLGDYHEHHQWRENDVLITYSGSTERWSLGEKSARGINIIDLETKRLDRREISTRPFVYITEVEDPIKTIDAYSEQLGEAVICVYLGDDNYSIKEIEEHARSYDALTVRVRDKREREEATDEPITVQLDFGNIDAMVSERLAQMEVSPTTLKIDDIIREPSLVDSKVDEAVSKVLAALRQEAET